MAIKSLKGLTERANKLKELRQKRDEIYAEYRTEVDPIEVEIEKLNIEILAGFKAIGVNTIKLDTGESYTRVVKQGVEIIDEPHALQWAKEHNLVSINKILLKQELKNYKELPPFFKAVELEEVRVTKPKEVKE